MRKNYKDLPVREIYHIHKTIYKINNKTRFNDFAKKNMTQFKESNLLWNKYDPVLDIIYVFALKNV